MGVDVWVFAFDFVDSLAEVSDELLLVPVVEEDAGKCSEWWLRDGCTGVCVGVEFELGNTVQQEPAQQVRPQVANCLPFSHVRDVRFFRSPLDIPLARIPQLQRSLLMFLYDSARSYASFRVIASQKRGCDDDE